MRISLFSQSLFAFPLPEAAAKTREAGYSAIELACARPHLDQETARSRADGVADEIRRQGLTVSALSLFNCFTDRGKLTAQVRAAATFLALAPRFGADLVKLTPGPPASCDATEDHWRCLDEAVAELVPVARENGVRLAFETHMRQLTDTLASSRRFLRTAPPDCVGLTVDFSNLRFAGECLQEAIPLLAGRLFHTHVKNGHIDADGGWQFTRLDSGLTDYDEVIPLLRQAGYDGYLSVECLGPRAQARPVATAREDLAILTRYLGGGAWPPPEGEDVEP